MGGIVLGVVFVVVLAAALAQAGPTGGLRLVGRFVLAVFTLGSTALAVLLVWVGQKAHWTSDGPGMLLVMFGIVFFGLVAFFGWVSLLGGPPRGGTR